jgi:hypothetical protein
MGWFDTAKSFVGSNGAQTTTKVVEGGADLAGMFGADPKYALGAGVANEVSTYASGKQGNEDAVGSVIGIGAQYELTGILEDKGVPDWLAVPLAMAGAKIAHMLATAGINKAEEMIHAHQAAPKANEFTDPHPKAPEHTEHKSQTHERHEGHKTHSGQAHTARQTAEHGGDRPVSHMSHEALAAAAHVVKGVQATPESTAAGSPDLVSVSKENVRDTLQAKNINAEGQEVTRNDVAARPIASANFGKQVGGLGAA